MAAVNLYWIPIGAGGNGFVRNNGRIYEALCARRERRASLDLYHAAMDVELAGVTYVIENAWPSPNANVSSRGVVAEGPVFAAWAGRWRAFRYEVRCWEGGVIPDIADAVGGPRSVSSDIEMAERIVATVASVPVLTWGRKLPGTGDMWNSNSTIAWVLSTCGAGDAGLAPPTGGRAPGWAAGLARAARDATRSGD